MGNTHHNSEGSKSPRERANSPRSPRERKLSLSGHSHKKEISGVGEALVGLPLEVSQSFSEIHQSSDDSKKGEGWVKYRNGRGGQMHYKEFSPESKEYGRTMEMIEKYLGNTSELKCTKILQVYNEKSLNEFYKKWSSSTSIPVEFNTSPRGANGIPTAKEQVMRNYSELLDRNCYNTDRFANTILMTAHGSEEVYAFEVAMQGFSDCATSNGAYGDGIYTMTNPLFCYPYFRGARVPVILLSWALPGEVNFISSQMDDAHLSKNSFASNFVCVDHSGNINEDFSQNKYQEIILANDNQYLPAYILFLSRENFKDLDLKWNRKIIDPKLYQPVNKSKEHKPDADLEQTVAEVQYFKMESSEEEEKEDSKLIWTQH